jgi:hypothetical protein
VVIRFFETNRIPVSFREEEASGEIHVKGCSPTGCGSDDALVGLRVKVDTAGTVTAVPEVVALYTDCM